jgi:hypothetical protein
MFICFVKYSSVINLDLFCKQLFSYRQWEYQLKDWNPNLTRLQNYPQALSLYASLANHKVDAQTV